MPVTSAWDTDEKYAIRLQISGKWGWDEMWRALNDIHALLEEINYTVCIIIPETERVMHTLPPGLLTQVGAFNRHRHPRSGLMLFIDERRSSGGRLWFRMVGTVYPQFYDRFKFVDSLDEARQIAQARYQQQIQPTSKTHPG